MKIVLKTTTTQVLKKAGDVKVGDVLRIGGVNHEVTGIAKVPVIECQNYEKSEYGESYNVFHTVIRYEINTPAMTIRAKADVELLVERDTSLKPFNEMKTGEMFQKENEPCVKVTSDCYVNLLRTEYRTLHNTGEKFFTLRIDA